MPSPPQTTTRPRVHVIYGCQRGQTTLDSAAEGGNPFASALIAAATAPAVRMLSLARRLRALTRMLSDGHQDIDVHSDGRLPAWPLAGGGRRQALVLIVSDYTYRGTVHRLLGAAHDERRIAAMLAGLGYTVAHGVGPDRADLRRALDAFRKRALRAEASVIYMTGHALADDTTTYLLPRDFPRDVEVSSAALQRHAISVARAARAAASPGLNLVFFAGCRVLVPGTSGARSPRVRAPRPR